MIPRHLGIAGAVAAAAFAGLVLSLSAEDPGETHLVLLQQKPNLHVVQLQEGESSLGDLMLFDAPFASEDGGTNGILTGSLLVVDLPDSADQKSNGIQSRLTHLVFNFEGRGTIVVGGSAVYPSDSAAEIVPNQPQVRAITGGTGEFIGASGELMTVRGEDGTYTHDFTLLD